MLPIFNIPAYKGASTLCHTAKCNKMRLWCVANAENSVDVNVLQLQHGFCMPWRVAECCVAWKFDRQNSGLIKGLLCRYLLPTLVRRNFWCRVWSLRVSRSTVFVNWNIVGKKFFINVDANNSAAYVEQLLPHGKAAFCSICWATFATWQSCILRHMLSNFCHVAKLHSAAWHSGDSPLETL